ncbi:unnamed protein product [Enterobius vermicularis]|uniref:Peptide chain release factor 1 n=1 Tax=Enterobius vermicularis TaxID=51028 RepID=A0A0N4V1M8_ENTVE|nr:unnamed protein product [Enterobius vermicularis]
MATDKLEALAKEWRSLWEEMQEMEVLELAALPAVDASHNKYLVKLNELNKIQEERQKVVKHFQYRLRQIEDDLKG